MALSRSQRKTRLSADVARVVSVDLTNTRVGIGSTLPRTTLDVSGNLNATTVISKNAGYVGTANSATSFSDTPSFTGTGIVTAFSFTGIGSGISGLGFTSIALIVDKKERSTNAGTFTSGADRTRDLNTIIYSGGFEDASTEKIVTLDPYVSNQFNLEPGEYIIEWSAPAFRIDNHMSHLYQSGIGATGVGIRSVYGINSYNQDSNFYYTTHSTGMAYTSLSDTGYYEIRHRCSGTRASYGLGISNWYTGGAVAGDDIHAYYTTVKISKF